jgi:hypothetical protein
VVEVMVKLIVVVELNQQEQLIQVVEEVELEVLQQEQQAVQVSLS